MTGGVASRRGPAASDHAAMADLLVGWFSKHGRDLPWRRVEPTLGRRDPYKSLVSEIMLQQTQVARVVPKFVDFVRAFPTVGALAAASEERVLAAWTGLGYYRRARSLHAAARVIVSRFRGEVPRTCLELTELPGVGRYTAGAVASIVFGRPEPIVDGNVSRVLLRVRGRDLASDDPTAVRFAWAEAGAFVAAAGPRAGAFNEGLMELGATVCMPDAPRCLFCPWQDRCVAHARGAQDRIPRPKTAATKRHLLHACVRVTRADGSVLVEQRPERGLWAGLWQVPTLERAGTGKPPATSSPRPPSAASMSRWLGAGLRLARAEEFVFEATHRSVRFVVFQGEATAEQAAALAGPERSWRTPASCRALAMSSPMRRILGLP